MTHNQKLLAQIVAHHALLKASRADVRPSQGRVMEALSEAIEGKRDEVKALVLAGRFETDTYRWHCHVVGMLTEMGQSRA
jgi:hypothetical protein